MGAVGVLADDRDAAVVLDPGVDDHALVGPGDDPGAVGAEDARLRDRRETLADPEVEMVERRRPQLHEHVVRAGFRIGHLFVPQHLGAAVLVDSDRFHVTIRP